MSADGFAGYDVWKCSPPVDERPEPPDVHDECEREIERLQVELDALTDEVGLRDQEIERLEIELAACKETRLS